MNKYSKEEEIEIARKYIDGYSPSVLCQMYGFKTKKSITDKVKKYFGKEYVRTIEEAMTVRFDRYNILNFRMEKIDSRFKAYFLGLMTSDGCVHNNNKGIELSMTDEDVIKFCSINIGKDYKQYIKNNDRKDIFRILFHHTELENDLKRYNIVPNKTHIIEGFEFYKDEEKFIPYYVRGCIDGDGWIRKDGKEFFICSASEKYIVWLKELLESKLYMEDLNITLDEKGVYYLRTALEKNINILKTVIYDKPYGMARKYNLVHQIDNLNDE